MLSGCIIDQLHDVLIM